MGSECWFCHKQIIDDDDVVRDRYGVNLEIHVDCLQKLREADGTDNAPQEARNER